MLDNWNVLEPNEKVNNGDSGPCVIKEKFKKVLIIWMMAKQQELMEYGRTSQKSGWRHAHFIMLNNDLLIN